MNDDYSMRAQVRHLTAENLRLKERWYDANCVIRRLAALPARWRNHYADRVADAVASRCAEDVDEVLQTLRGVP